MIKKIITPYLFGAVSMYACTISLGQDAMQPQLYFVEEVVVKPSERDNFQETIKEFLNYFEEQNFQFEVSSYMTSDFHIYFTFPLEGAGDVEDLFTGFNNLAEKVDPVKWAELISAEYKAIESVEYSLYYMRPDLSYFPENPRITEEETNYLEWTFAYVKPGKDAEAEAIWKEWAELYKEKGVTDPYYTWVGFIGPEVPLYLFIFPGKNAIDFHQAGLENMAKLGEDAKPLYEKTYGLIKKLESRTGWVLQDLFYSPNGE
jgi:hypothetical protein